MVVAIEKHASLSSPMRMGFGTVTYSYFRSIGSQISSAVAALRAMYSASAVDLATEDCSLER